MDNHPASSCACQPLAANYFVVKSGNRVSLSGDKARDQAACGLQPACMATKPNAGTSHILEQTIEDLPSGLTLTFEAHPDGTRLVIGGPSLRGGFREILFDAEGRLIATGPVLKKVHM